jgi:hypothetical protein
MRLFDESFVGASPALLGCVYPLVRFDLMLDLVDPTSSISTKSSKPKPQQTEIARRKIQSADKLGQPHLRQHLLERTPPISPQQSPVRWRQPREIE